MSSPAEPRQADWPAQSGSSSKSSHNNGTRRSSNSRRAGPQDAPAAAPISSGGRVVVHRRSSSSSSTTVVVHSYEKKWSPASGAGVPSAPATEATARDAAPPNNSPRGSRRRPTNYANADDNDAQRRPFSQANKLPSSPAPAPNSASQRGVNQVGWSSAGAAASVPTVRPIDSQQQQQRQQKQRQIMNNNNKANWAESATNYVAGRGEAAAPGATGNTSHKRSRRPLMAPDAPEELSEEADYSLIDTPDLQANWDGNQREPPATRRPHSAANQMNRSLFYDNLFKTNHSGSSHEAASRRPPLTSAGATDERANGRRRVDEQPGMVGAARRAKSATLAGREGGHADSGYDEIGPPAARASHQQRLSRQQVVAHGQAIRNDLITSMKSPHRASMRLGASGHQNSAPPRTNGSSDNNSMAPYGSFGSASQRASRSSLSARSSRVGKFVNYYPASRQPQSGSPGHKRHTSPYAFHVPPQRLRSPEPRASSPVSPYCPYGSPVRMHNVYGAPAEYLLDPDDYLIQRVGLDELGGDDDDENNEEADHLVAKAEIKQTRYGYVAPVERLESRQQPPALSRFNKSLKSRTIGHIPSMVQVSVDDNLLPAAHSPHFLAHSYNNRSEGDLLKAHRVVWRNSSQFDAGHDNPFKPGTELSLEADLMVRLIKRGYPIEELPHLVQATKEVLAAKQRAHSPAAKSKSCDKLAAPLASRAQKSTGYLNSNLRQFNDQAYAIEEGGQDERRAKSKYQHSVSHSHLLPSGNKNEAQEAVRAADDLEPCKRIWANSLSRAKSMPRFNYATAKGDGGNKLKSALVQSATLEDDVDSLDKLISDIEREISDLLVSNSPDPASSPVCASATQETDDGNEGTVAIATVPAKTKQRDSPKRKIRTANSSPKREPKTSAGQQTEKIASSTSTPSFAAAKRTRAKNDLTSSRSDELLLTSEANSTLVVKKKKKSRCCLIQ